MKYFVVLVALLGSLAMGFEIRSGAQELASQRSIASIIVDILNEIQDQMPCGFPALGIPPLAPLVIAHQEINIKTDSFSLDAEINNFTLNGLDEARVIVFKVNPALGRLNFEMEWNNVFFSTKYKVHAASTSGFKFDFAREGNAEFGIKKINVAVTANYNLGVASGSLVLNEFFLYLNIGEVTSNIDNLSSNAFVNRMLNDIIEEWFNIAINDYTQEIAQLANDNIVPLVNNLIDGRSLEEIIAGLTGGSKGTSKAECIPPAVAA